VPFAGDYFNIQPHLHPCGIAKDNSPPYLSTRGTVVSDTGTAVTKSRLFTGVEEELPQVSFPDEYESAILLVKSSFIIHPTVFHGVAR